MNPEFTFENGLVEFTPWKKRGIIHGFSGAKLQPEGIILIKQLHSDLILDLRNGASLSENKSGDAIIASCSGESLRIGVVTADCLPILVLGKNSVAAIHAGWRGIACGIIGKVIAQLQSSQNELEFVIGPCAGPERYEVGKEVIDAIGPTAKAKPINGKYLLDLALTAKNQVVRALGENVRVSIANICTISNTEFHSFRREGKTGRNISFISSRIPVR